MVFIVFVGMGNVIVNIEYCKDFFFSLIKILVGWVIIDNRFKLVYNDEK